MAFLTHVLEQTPRYLILIQEGAPYHTSAAPRAFVAHYTTRLQVFQLPSYSPDDNPIEKLWKKIKKDGTHLPYFPTFDVLKEKVEQALLKFEHTPKEILARCSLPAELANAA